MSLPDFLPPLAPLPGIGMGPADAPAAAVAGATSAVVAAPNAFGRLVVQGLEQTSQSLLDGQAAMQRLAAGDMGNLHQVMLKLEESRLSFQLMLQVRNRLLESYQDVMRMQV